MSSSLGSAAAATAAITAPLLSSVVVGKKPTDGAVPVIGTHNGTFHCDEALACGLLKLLPTYKASPIVRTRDAPTLDSCNIVVDVGAVYDAERLRFDHHQASFTGRYRDGAPTKLSSAGLVYKHFGPQIIQEIASAVSKSGPLDAPTLAKLVERTYDRLILEIDAIDNGVEVSAGPFNYRVHTGLSSRVAKLNPLWNEAADEVSINARFAAAMHMTATEFVDYVVRTVTAWLPAREIVVAARAGARSVHPSGQILRLDQFAPWKEHLFELEEEEEEGAPSKVDDGEGGAAASPAKRARGEDSLPKALYLLAADTNGSWRVHAVPESPDSFASRKALPAAWRGLRDQQLSDKAGVPGCIFVHASGFIGGAQTYEGALALASKALEL